MDTGEILLKVDTQGGMSTVGTVGMKVQSVCSFSVGIKGPMVESGYSWT